jgi:hypothetical protein
MSPRAQRRTLLRGQHNRRGQMHTTTYAGHWHLLSSYLRRTTLGIHSATFVHPSVGIWKATPNLTCALIAERVIKLGPRDKPDPDKVAESDAVRTFCKRVTGAWWQRIPVKDVSAVSFFQIKRDTVFNSLSLSGSSYDKTGALVGFWESIMARIYAEENKVLYSWKGWHILAGMTHISFHGFGEVDFEGEATVEALISRGQGRFWKVDEANPAETINTPMQLRRVTDKTAISTMTSEAEKEVRMLIRQTLAEW